MFILSLHLVLSAGQVLSWGAGDYGQLGHGNQFDDPQPRLVNQLHHVTSIAAGTSSTQIEAL